MKYFPLVRVLVSLAAVPAFAQDGFAPDKQPMQATSVSLSDTTPWVELQHKVEQLSSEGRYLEAWNASEKALQEAERFGSADTRVARTLNEMGLAAYALGWYAPAEKCYLRGIRVAENGGGGDHLLLAKLFNSLASLYEGGSRRYAAAHQLRRRALDLAVSEFGPDHPALGPLLTNLGTVCVERRLYSEARTYFERALNVLAKSPNAKNTDSANALANLGVLEYQLGRYEESLSYTTRSLELYRRVLQPDHPEFVLPLLNLGRIYVTIDRAILAEPPLQRALNIARSVLGNEHPTVAEILSTYSIVLKKTERKKEAKVLAHQANVIAARNHGGVSGNSIVDISELATGR